MPIEKRFFTQQAELRIEKRADKPSLITGYPAKFNTRSQELWGFRETILPGCFTRTLSEGADVRALINHDANLVLGRNVAGTLRLVEDKIGLRMEIDAPDTQAARDLMTSIDRGDVTQGSFGFRTITDNWRTLEGETIRELIDVDLRDVSVVTFPAYEDTIASVRSALSEDGKNAAGIDFEHLAGILVRSEHQLEITDADRQMLTRAVALLQQAGKPAATPALDRARRRMRLMDAE